MTPPLRRLPLVVSLLAVTASAADPVVWWRPAEPLGCEAAPAAEARFTPREPRQATVAEVARWTKAGAAVPVDANAASLRATAGVIPGAVLLTSTSTYELRELPADRSARLVFYCANERCTASLQAARRALEAGYRDVAVLPVGIQGWKAAGQPTAEPGC